MRKAILQVALSVMICASLFFAGYAYRKSIVEPEWQRTRQGEFVAASISRAHTTALNLERINEGNTGAATASMERAMEFEMAQALSLLNGDARQGLGDQDAEVLSRCCDEIRAYAVRRNLVDLARSSEEAAGLLSRRR